jgi:D-aminopeptidase
VRVLFSADAENMTSITNSTELFFGKPRGDWMRGMMTCFVDAAD